jgi:hypothetical protein
MNTDELLLHLIDTQGCWQIRPDGSNRKGFMLNVNYRDVVDAINTVVPYSEDGTYKKGVKVSRKMMMSIILTRHLSETAKLKTVAHLLNVSSHALIVHYRKQHDKKMSSRSHDDADYQKSFHVILDMLSYQNDKNKQRIDNLLSGLK